MEHACAEARGAELGSCELLPGATRGARLPTRYRTFRAGPPGRRESQAWAARGVPATAASPVAAAGRVGATAVPSRPRAAAAGRTARRSHERGATVSVLD
jgi:hypothetical protein